MKTLLMYGSWGWGHKKAALALQEALQARAIPAESVDVLDLMPRPFASLYSLSYTMLVTRFRYAWKWIYESTDRNWKPYAPHESPWQAWQFAALLRYLNQQDFTHFISTHFLTSALLAGWRKQYGWNRKIFTVVTDFTAHRYWKQVGLDHYFVPSAEVRNQLLCAGIARTNITVSGIPVSSGFKKGKNCAVRETFGCPADENLILVLTSGFDRKKSRQIIKELKQIQARFLISAGKHAPAVAEMQSWCNDDPRFTVFGITDRMPEMMLASDLLISKPGGVTTSEALAIGLPLVLLPPIPGQEEGNATYLSRMGAAVRCTDQPGDLKQIVDQLLSDPSRLSAMRNSCARLGKWNAAETIIDRILLS